MIKRSLYINTWNKLSKYKSMIFIAGPRQVGKTTLSTLIAEKYSNTYYFNWDIIENKEILIKDPYFYEKTNRKDNSLPLIIFDEIHKYHDWKNYLKNVYDRDKDNYQFIVSGSGRLDLYKRHGDSLAGRYLLFYLFPFTLGELFHKKSNDIHEFINDPLQIYPETNQSLEIWKKLESFTGFPEPFVQSDHDFYKIWSRTYHHQLLKEDILNTGQINKLSQVELLFALLPGKIGSPLSILNLSRDIKVAYDTVKSWLTIFKHYFLTFEITPWFKKIARAIHKERKLYLYDYGIINNPAAKYENMVALELLRAITNWTDLGIDNFGLHYIRTKEKEEVDFLITKNNEPFLLIECKLKDQTLQKSLLKIQKMLNIPAILLINEPGTCYLATNENQKVMVVSADRWLSCLV